MIINADQARQSQRDFEAKFVVNDNWIDPASAKKYRVYDTDVAGVIFLDEAKHGLAFFLTYGDLATRGWVRMTGAA